MAKHYVWIDQRLLNIVAFGGKGQEAPPPPDFSAIAQADATAANNNLELGREQLDWGRNQFNTVWPYAQQYLNTQTQSNQQESANAQNAQDFYQNTYRPLETQYANEASNYNTPARAEANAGAAMADVAYSFQANREAAQQQLESFGIDPSQTRFGALDLSSRVQRAAATAAAGTQSRRNTEATGLGLQGAAIDIGRGYPGNVAQAYSTATSAGSAGIGAANQTTQTGSNTMGTPYQFGALQTQNLGNQGNVLTQGYNATLARTQMNNQLAANQASGIGSLIGGAAGIGALFL